MLDHVWIIPTIPAVSFVIILLFGTVGVGIGVANCGRGSGSPGPSTA